MAQSLWIRVLVTITALVVTSLAGPEQLDRQSTPSCSQVAQDLQQKILNKIGAAIPVPPRIKQVLPTQRPITIGAPNTKQKITATLVSRTMTFVLIEEGTGTPTLTKNGDIYTLTVYPKSNSPDLRAKYVFRTLGTPTISATVYYYSTYSPGDITLRVQYRFTSANNTAVVENVDIQFSNTFDQWETFFYNTPADVKKVFAKFVLANFWDFVSPHEAIHDGMMKKLIKEGIKNVNFTHC